MNLRDLASFYRLRKKLSENPKSIVTDEDKELINDVPLINDVAVETQGTNPDLYDEGLSDKTNDNEYFAEDDKETYMRMNPDIPYTSNLFGKYKFKKPY